MVIRVAIEAHLCNDNYSILGLLGFKFGKNASTIRQSPAMRGDSPVLLQGGSSQKAFPRIGGVTGDLGDGDV